MTHATASAAVDSWLGSGLGQAVLQAESELMSEALDDVFGWELLQLGTWGPRELAACPVVGRDVTPLSPTDVSRLPDADIGARLSQLPIANGAVDAVVLPHTLEFETDPYAVVREADRVLAGEGQLIVLGFRPFSLWGFRSRAISRGYPPGLKRMLGAPRRRLARAARLRRLADAQLSVHAALGRHAPRPACLRRCCAVAGSSLARGAYLIKARKRVYTLTPIRPRVRERAQPSAVW